MSVSGLQIASIAGMVPAMLAAYGIHDVQRDESTRFARGAGVLMGVISAACLIPGIVFG